MTSEKKASASDMANALVVRVSQQETALHMALAAIEFALSNEGDSRTALAMAKNQIEKALGHV